MRLTLLERPGRTSASDFTTSLNKSLSNLQGNLSVAWKPIKPSRQGWAKIDVEGADEEIFIQLVAKKFSLTNSDFSAVELHANYAGHVARFTHDLEVDIGIEYPKPVNVTVKLASLRAQLADGKAATSKEIQEAYCLSPGSRLDIRITTRNPDGLILAGWLADSQIESFSSWITSGLDRVQIFNCTREQVDYAVRKTNLERDIVSTESMTLTSHALTCKLGTDGAGLIPKLGRILRRSELKLFLPKRIFALNRSW